MVPEDIVASFGIEEGIKIADFGSGAGYFTILLAEAVGESGLVTAVDIMETALDSVRAKAKTAGVKNVNTVRSNLEVIGSSGLSDNSQDMVLLANILFQSQQKEDIIKEAKRVLKPDGRLVVIDWKKEAGGAGPPDHLRIDRETIRQTVSKLGFDFESDIDAGIFHFGMILRKN